MKIYRDLSELGERLPTPVATIGNFDGVHRGHREMFRRVIREARELGGTALVVTFIPHPLKVLPVGKTLRLITTYAEKERLIAASGIDCLLTIPFTAEFAQLTPRGFVEEVLVGNLGVRRLVIGYDYAFGRNREGSVTELRRLGEEFGFAVEVLEPISSGGVVYSSSMIRRMIAAGQVREVVPYLGRHFSLRGTVVHGRHRGLGLGFPTANLVTDQELLPGDGVYAVRVQIGDREWDGAGNIGTNPTFGPGERSLEVHLFDFAGDLYGQEVRLTFIDRVRDERRFADAAALQEQICRDVVRCREILADNVARACQDEG